MYTYVGVGEGGEGKNPVIAGGGVGGRGVGEGEEGGGGCGDIPFLAGGASVQLRPGLRSLHRQQGGRPCQGARAAAGGKDMIAFEYLKESVPLCKI